MDCRHGVATASRAHRRAAAKEIAELFGVPLAIALKTVNAALAGKATAEMTERVHNALESVMLAIMRDKSQPDSARVDASEWLARSEYGPDWLADVDKC